MAVYQTRLTKLQKAAEEELKEIERERFLNHLKNYGGAALAFGSAFIPAAGGARIVGAMTKVLAPKIGLKTAYEVAKGAVSGAMSGGVLGLGDSLINNENPLTTSLRYSLIGALSGGGLGLGSSVIVKNNLKNTILTNTNNNELLEQYYNDYVNGIISKNNELSEYRRLKTGIKNKGNISTEYDKINKYKPKQIWLNKQEYAIVMHEINTNITKEELNKLYIRKNIGNYEYTIFINDFDDYIIVGRKTIK